jgi:hypothetical protein
MVDEVNRYDYREYDQHERTAPEQHHGICAVGFAPLGEAGAAGGDGC